MDIEMNINDQQAKESLEMIQQTTLKTKKAIAASYTSPWLILWGALWFVAYSIAHFYLQHAALIFTTMSIVGCIGSGILIWWQKTKAAVKDTSSNPLDRKIFWFWFFLFLYISIWMMIMQPNGFQLNVVIVTAVMFAYIVMGLFYEEKYLAVLGILVTAIALLTYFFFARYYCLSMAFCGGGSLLGTGIYMRLMWR